MLALDDKEIKVEIILAIRGFYAQFSQMADDLDTLENQVAELDSDVADLYSRISSLESNSDDD